MLCFQNAIRGMLGPNLSRNSELVQVIWLSNFSYINLLVLVLRMALENVRTNSNCIYLYDMFYTFTFGIQAYSQPHFYIRMDSSTTVSNSLPISTKTLGFNTIHLCIYESPKCKMQGGEVSWPWCLLHLAPFPSLSIRKYVVILDVSGSLYISILIKLHWELIQDHIYNCLLNVMQYLWNITHFEIRLNVRYLWKIRKRFA
jgi:hypothetical protein